jgi:hypothetical protein
MEPYFMSQARGRYAGSRRKGQHQPQHEEKSPRSRQGQPYAKVPPPELAQTASIFNTRSFQFLVNAVGAENIALALESNMTRVSELMRGERFTPETAFHMETTLGLPHGFFDQPNPALAAETIAHLKSPLDFIQPDNVPGIESEGLNPAPALNVEKQPTLDDNLSEEVQMPRKVAGGSPRAVKNSRGKPAGQPKPYVPEKASTTKYKTAPATPQQQPLVLSDRAEVENVRRANLHILTGRNGSKARLGVVMAMSGSNMAHRLYGKKRMDSVEANRFTERLGLPTGWLDSPRTEAEIPESVSRLLSPAPRGRASVQQHELLVPATINDVQGKLADGTVHTRRERVTSSSDSESPSPVSVDVTNDEEKIIASSQARANDFTDDLAGCSPEERDGEDAAALPVPLESPSVSAIPQNPIPLPFASVTSLDNLHGIAPVAEALIKTLAGKARTGRLDEQKALELLQQAVLL